MQRNLAESTVMEERAAAIAHEVKNPLTMVGLNLDILEASDKRLGADKNYAMIRKELRKISELMIDFIYLSSNQQKERGQVVIKNLLGEIIEDFSVSLPNIALDITYPSVEFILRANESDLRTLFGNIVKNAAEAMEYCGKIQIEVSARERHVNISFKDNGPGLCEAAQSKIFKEHFTTKPMGSGLGLSICQKIAQEHGGSFTLENLREGGCLAVVKLAL